MPTYLVTAPSGRKLKITGDVPPSKEQLDTMFAKYDVQQERTFGEQASGVMDAVATAVTGTLAQPVAGIAGLARTITQGPEAGAARVKELQDRLTFQPSAIGAEYLQDVANLPVIKQAGEVMERGSQQLGDLTYDVTGSPAAAAIAKGLPEAGAAALGFKAPDIAAVKLGAKAQDLASQANAATKAANAGLDNNAALGASPAVAEMRKLSPERIRDIADVDPEFFKALDNIGVTKQPLTSYASRNKQFRSLEQGLNALPASSLSNIEADFIKDLSNSAEGVMQQYGAVKDSAEASMKWRDASLKTVNELGRAAHKAYDALNEVVDARQPAKPVSTMEFISERTKNLPLQMDDPDVPAPIKSAISSLKPRQRTNPETGEVEAVPANYASMDSLRKDIGAAVFNKEGPFKDADSGLLKNLYGSLTDDLNAMAESQGLVNEVKAAKALVAQRKQLETQMQDLIGKDLQKDIVPVVQQGIKGLSKGGLQRYVETMKNIPEPEVRQELVMTALQDTFSGTRAGEKGFLTTDYLKWYNDTLAKPTVRNLMAKDLPEGALDKLDSLAKISQGIAKANADKVKTGVVLSLLDDKAGMVRRMVGGGIQQTIGRIPLPTGEVASAVGEILKGGTNRSKAAGELLASPQFAAMIQQGVAKGVVTGRRADKALQAAEAKMMKSKKYQAWADTLSNNDKAKIASVGLTQFLLQPNAEDKKQ
jgi:hypothetical protein